MPVDTYPAVIGWLSYGERPEVIARLSKLNFSSAPDEFRAQMSHLIDKQQARMTVRDYEARNSGEHLVQVGFAIVDLKRANGSLVGLEEIRPESALPIWSRIDLDL